MVDILDEKCLHCEFTWFNLRSVKLLNPICCRDIVTCLSLPFLSFRLSRSLTQLTLLPLIKRSFLFKEDNSNKNK